MTWFAKWNGSKWERKSTPHCTEAVNPQDNIPAPKFNLGQEVRFDWGKATGRGYIEEITCWSMYPEPTYWIVWLGHGRMVSQHNILEPS
jgi:hypothetical protein